MGGDIYLLNETRKRTIIKTVTYRVVMFLMSLSIVYILFGDILLSGVATILGVITGSIYYYFHERLWNKISWETY